MKIYVLQEAKQDCLVIDVGDKLSEIIEVFDDKDIVKYYKMKNIKRITIFFDESLEILMRNRAGKHLIEQKKCHETFGDLKEKINAICFFKYGDDVNLDKMFRKLETKLEEDVNV